MFKYVSTKSPKELYDIFKEVQGLKAFAKSRYGNNYEDALDASYEHIVKNYDSSKGELKNYTTKVVGTILLNSNKKESANDEQTQISLDLKTAEEYSITNGVEEAIYKSNSVDSCITDMASYFVHDYKFFSTENSKHRKMNYSSLIDKYTSDSIFGAMRYLKDTYSSDIERLINFSKDASIRNFKEDRYLKSIDTSLVYIGCLNDIVLINRKQGSHVKKLFLINIQDMVNLIISLFYTNNEYGKIVVEGIPIYLTLSGQLVNSIDELKFYLEKELVGSLLSRSSLKVVNYDRGVKLLLSSTKDTQGVLYLPVFGKNIGISFERVVVKEV